MTIEISLVDIIFRVIATGICAIIVFVLIAREWKRTAKFWKEADQEDKEAKDNRDTR